MSPITWLFLTWLAKFAVGSVAFVTALHVAARAWRKRRKSGAPATPSRGLVRAVTAAPATPR